jgi:hypothetical protein
MLNDYFIEEGRIATQKYAKDGVKLGVFQQNLIKLGIQAGKRFKKQIPLWEEKYPELFKVFRTRIQSNEDNPPKKDMHEKVKMLYDYFKSTGNLMSYQYIINGIKLGVFQQNIVRGLKKNIIYKKEIPVWEKTYPELFREFRNHIEQAPKKKIKKNCITPEDKIKLINEYFEKEGKLIPFKYIRDDINLGDFRADLIECFKNGKGYEKYMSKWKKKYPKLLEAFQHKISENEEKKRFDISADDKIRMLNEYFKSEEKLASQTYVKDGVKLGVFQQNLIRLGLYKNQRYKKEIPIWEQKYPELFKEFRIRIQKLDDNPPDTTSKDFKVKILNDFVVTEKKLVSQKYVKDGVKLGTFQSNLLKAIKTKSLYKKELPVWEETYPELFKALRERVQSVSKSVSDEDDSSIVEESEDNDTDE